jgi:hypothetical protein
VTTCPFQDNVGPDHFFCGLDFCDASNECAQPCPTGYDAQCPSGQRCFANTPCNSNIEARSANFLNYGLPRSRLELLRSYRPDGEGQTNNSADHRKLFPVVGLLLLFGLFVSP